jgi:Chaperone of endosialidase
MPEINSIPVQFELKNATTGEGILYTKGAGSDNQTLLLNIINKSRGDLNIAQVIGTAAAESFHFALCFPPGMLQKPELISIAPGPGNTNAWSMAWAKDRTDADCFYLLKTDSAPLALAPDKSLAFAITKVNVSESGGSRNATVELRYRRISLAGQPLPEGFRRQYLSVLNAFPVNLSDLENISSLGGLRDQLEVLRDRILPPLSVRIYDGWNYLIGGREQTVSIEISLNTTFWGLVADPQVSADSNTEIRIEGGDKDIKIVSGESLSPTEWNASAATEQTNTFVKATAKSGITAVISKTKTLRLKVVANTGPMRLSSLRVICKNLKSAQEKYEDFELTIPLYVGSLAVLPKGAVSIGSGYALSMNSMERGSLTIGATDLNYGGGTNQWNGNTAGLMLECAANTEIAVHDSNTRVASLLYYEGDTANRITLGRNMGWGKSDVRIANNLNIEGKLAVGMTTVPTATLEVVGKGGTNVDFIVNGRMMSNNNDGGFWVKDDRFVGGHSTDNIGIWNGAAWRLSVNKAGAIALNGPQGDENTNGVLFVGAGGWPNLRMGVVNDGAEARGWIQTHGSKPLYINPLGNNVIINKGGGSVGIGTITPRQKLDVNGNLFVNDQIILDSGAGQQWQIYAEKSDPGDPDLFFHYSGNRSGWASGWLEPMGSGWRNNSDASLKTNVEALAGVLEKVLQLRPVEYHFTNEEAQRPKHLGFIAQEVEAVFPDMVKEKRNLKSLNYTDFGVLAIAAIREQQALIEQLKSAVNTLKEKINQ